MELSLRERDRVSVPGQVSEGVLAGAAGAARLGVTRRHFRRLVRRFEAVGDAAAVHGLKGRRSNRSLPAEVREVALSVAADPLYADFGPTLPAEHLERRFAVVVSPDTLRRWMLEAGLWERRRRRARHRSRRPRRAALGELGQWDSSVHPWLEERSPGSRALISIRDDATSRLLMARFVARDNGAENRRAIIEYLGRHGRPVAVYTDHAGHFGQWLSKKEERTGTIISRALGELGVEVILAGSPQAKGRVERSFGTNRDRLVKEMRLEGIASLEGANRFLQDYRVPFWNERFTVEPADPRDAHRPLPAGADLEALFAETETRVAARDFTIRFRKRRWQIPEREAGGIAPSAEIVVERRLDGDIRFRFGDRYLGLEPVRQAPAASPNDAPAKPRPAPPKPAPDHPWRKHFQASAQQATARRNLRREREGISNENERPRIPEATGAWAKTGTPGEDISIAV
ncbi:ISNCY family transposase [Candidatus Palauibacter sp.]|uniref:ISNCY family transposase n=1 Tax=Candidatus Palauibacter sp. TaxID=3101350 RepID=UPI003B58BC14